jgi:hypothetical protein
VRRLARIRTFSLSAEPAPLQPPAARVSDAGQDLEELVAYVVRSADLDAGSAKRLVDDILAYLDEEPEHFVRRRHDSLRKLGVSNAEAFEQIAAELRARRFAAPRYSLRQIRRIIYG